MEYQLPSSWESVTLGDISLITYGKGLPTKNLLPSGYPVFGANSVIGFYDNYLYEDSQLLISCRGAGSGTINFSPPKCFITNNSLIIGFPTEADVLRKTFYYFLQSVNKDGLITGSAQPQVTINNAVELKLNLPPLNEQKRIVTKIEELFSELDSGIASLKTAQEKLKVYRQAVLKHAFEGKLTAQWRENNKDKLETPEQLLTRIQQERENRYQEQLTKWEKAVEKWEAGGKEGKKPSKPKIPEVAQLLSLSDSHYLNDIPKEWIILKAEHFCDFITKGTTPDKNELFSNQGDIPFIKVYNLTKNATLDFSIDPTFVSKATHSGFLARSKVYPNDVLMNIVGPPLGKVSIVPSAYSEWNINQAIAIYRSNIVLPKFLAEFLLFEKTVNFMMAQSKATAGQFNLTLEICRELPVPVAGKQEQEEIVKKLAEQLSNIDAVTKEINEQLIKTDTLRQSILQKAFSGQLVPQDPNDEPASELLARIQAEKAAALAQTKPTLAKRGRKVKDATNG
jgi:type I restriction enzyme S subunit